MERIVLPSNNSKEITNTESLLAHEKLLTNENLHTELKPLFDSIKEFDNIQNDNNKLHSTTIIALNNLLKTIITKDKIAMTENVPKDIHAEGT